MPSFSDAGRLPGGIRRPRRRAWSSTSQRPLHVGESRQHDVRLGSEHARLLARFAVADQSFTPARQEPALRDRVDSTH
jgi:hypothetical protein